MKPRFQGHGVTVVDVLYAQLTRDLFAIAKFLLIFESSSRSGKHGKSEHL